MHLFAFHPTVNDVLTACGFVVGLVSLAVGIAGFWYTLLQVWKVREAANAAEVAARDTLAETKEAYERFIGAFASRLIAEMQGAVTAKDWKLAAVRSNDLAELVATLPASGVTTRDAATEASVTGLREFGQLFADMATRTSSRLSVKLVKERWNPLLKVLHTELDQLRAPFRESKNGEVGPHDPNGEVPGDHTKPPREDEGRGGELGPEPVPRSNA